MQQLKKISILETVVFMRDSAYTICDVCDKQTLSVFRQCQLHCLK